MRTGVCQDCGGETVGGQRGVMPKRCAPCNKVYRAQYHAEREQHREPREKRLHNRTCEDCNTGFVWSGSGRPPTRCKDCYKTRRLAAARKRGQLRRDAEKSGKSPRIGVCVDCMEQFDGPVRGPIGSRCPSCSELHNKTRYKLNPQRTETVRALHLKKKYDMTPGEWDIMFAEQGGKCAICDEREEDGPGRLHVDHNHKTGKVRALLCQACNTTLGKMRERPDLLRAAAAYLELHAVG